MEEGKPKEREDFMVINENRDSPMVELPSAIEVEEQVLGAIMHEPDFAIPACVNRGVTELAFYLPANQFLFKYLLWRKEKEWPFDLTLIFEHLKKKGKLDMIGGPSALMKLTSSTSNLSHHLEVLMDTYARRIIFERISQIDSTESNADDIAGILKEVAEEASRLSIPESETKISEQVEKFAESLRDKIDNPTLSYGITVGAARLDDLTLGLHRKTLTGFVAKPSCGKTALMIQYAVEALLSGLRVIIFSMEMGDDEVIMRMACYLSRVEMSKIQKPKDLTQDEKARLAKALKKISAFKLVIDDRPALRASQITAKLDRGKFDAAFADYLQLMSPENHQIKKTRNEQLESVTRTLKACAKKNNMVVGIGSQLNEQNQTKDSKGLQEDAHIIMRILAKAKKEGEDPEVYGIKLDKNRNGKRFETAYCELDGALQRFNFH